MASGLSLVLVVILVSGCVSQSGTQTEGLQEPPAVHIPSLVPGDEALYVGSDGSFLTLFVEGYEPRMSAHYETVHSLIMRFDYGFVATPNRTHAFEEAVDPASGLQVQQHIVCMFLDDPEEFRCPDERGFHTSAGGGLPGGIGLGPLWGQELESGSDVVIELAPVVGSATTAHYVLGELDPKRCGWLTFSSDAAAGARTLPWISVGEGRLRVCDGDPLPLQYGTQKGITYERREATFVEVSSRSAAPLAQGEPAIEPVLREWKAPLIAADRSETSEFSVEEAHSVALEESTRYRALFESGGLLLGTHSSDGGEGYLGGDAWTLSIDRRTLMLYDPEGNGLRIRLEKHVQSFGTIPVVEYKVTEEEARRQAPQNTSTLLPRQMALGPAMALSERIVGTPPDVTAGHGLWTTLPDIPPYHVPQRADVIPGTLFVIFWHEDPTPIDRLVSRPYGTVFQASDGAFLWGEFDAARLPLVTVPPARSG